MNGYPDSSPDDWYEHLLTDAGVVTRPPSDWMSELENAFSVLINVYEVGGKEGTLLHPIPIYVSPLNWDAGDSDEDPLPPFN